VCIVPPQWKENNSQFNSLKLRHVDLGYGFLILQLLTAETMIGLLNCASHQPIHSTRSVQVGVVAFHNTVTTDSEDSCYGVQLSVVNPTTRSSLIKFINYQQPTGNANYAQAFVTAFHMLNTTANYDRQQQTPSDRGSPITHILELSLTVNVRVYKYKLQVGLYFHSGPFRQTPVTPNIITALENRRVLLC